MKLFSHPSTATLVLFALCACNKDGVRVINISADDTEPITSVIWQETDSSRFYYDLRVTESYYIFPDDKSDTIIRIYKKDNPGKMHNYHIRKQNTLNTRPLFLKSNTRYPADSDRLWMVENRISVKMLNPDNPPEQLLSSPVSFPFRTAAHSTDYNLTKDKIYAAPLDPPGNSPYYSFHPDSGYFRAEIYRHANVDYPDIGLASLACLTVSEENKSVVSAQRFMNDVLFYDLNGNIRTVASFGDGRHILPDTVNNTVDVDSSTKCFIYICGTERHVYCLYDGSTDYTARSKIVVFDWTGTHVVTYRTDRCLKQLAVDRDETRIVALAANEQHGRDVVLYDIKQLQIPK